MTYITKINRIGRKPNYKAAHAAHLRALERQRRESGKQIIAASKQAEEKFQAEKRARDLAASSASPIAQPKLSKKEERAAAAAAAKQERRRERRVAKAKAADEAEALNLEANEAILLARDMFRLRLGERKSKWEDGDDMDDVEEYEEETWPEFKSRVLGWHGIRPKAYPE